MQHDVPVESEARCIICNSVTEYFFSKKFCEYGIGKVDYYRCCECGFTISKTHAEMSSDVWQRINREFHFSFFGQESNALDPRWLSRLNGQANVLADCAKVGLLENTGRWLDYGCGDGKLSDILKHEHCLNMLKYDEYLSLRPDYLGLSDLVPGGFDFVITTSVFEHLTRRDQLDQVNALVAKDGVLGIHTLVRESIPCDPEWFYLHPVHCAFYTNESMRYLLRQWGYTCSLYNLETRLWLCFKCPPSNIEFAIAAANKRVGKPAYIFKRGFVDYWK